MSLDARRLILTPVAARPAFGLIGQAARLLGTAALVLLVVFSGYLTWQWLDRNLLHWGIEDGKVTVIDSAEIVERIRAPSKS